MELFKELAIDAYLLEAESNIKMAFFTYFSAIEAVIRYRLDEIKQGIYTELHDALEHLSLDDKVRIVAKNSFSTDSLSRVAIWGEYQGTLRDAKKNQESYRSWKAGYRDIYARFAKMYCLLRRNLLFQLHGLHNV